jgi:hypothetical protein
MTVRITIPARNTLGRAALDALRSTGARLVLCACPLAASPDQETEASYIEVATALLSIAPDAQPVNGLLTLGTNLRMTAVAKGLLGSAEVYDGMGNKWFDGDITLPGGNGWIELTSLDTREGDVIELSAVMIMIPGE